MATVSWENSWGGPNWSTMVAKGRTNLTSSSLPDYTNLSSTHGGAPFFWIIPENGSAATGLPTHTTPPPRTRDPALARAEIGVLALVLALTALGNGFVLWVLLRRRKHHAPMHVFMVNLCVADLVVAFFQVLPQLVWDITEHFQGPDALCRSVKYLQIVGMFASSYMIVAMTVDRHHAICFPLQAYRGGVTSRWNTPVIVAWGLSLVLSLPQVFIFSISEVSPGVFECWGHFTEPWGLKAYVTWMTVAVFLLPALIITICQIRIFREIHNNIYLKSERVVTAEYKRTSVLLRFQSRQQKGQRGRGGGGGGGGREGRGGHPLPADENSPSCIPFNSPPLASTLNPKNAYDNLSTHGCAFSNPPFDDREGSYDVPSLSLSYSTVPAPNYDLTNHQCPNAAESLPTPDSPEKSTTSSSLAPKSFCSQPSHSDSTASNSPPNPTNYELPPDSLPPDPSCHVPPAEYPPLAPPHPPPLGVSKAMSKTVRMTLVIVLVYTVCWSPFFIVQLWAAWDPNPPDQGVAFTILMLLASLNSCTNPWIYTAFSSSMSRELQGLLCCRSRSSRRGSLPDDSITTTHTSTTTKDGMY